MEGTEIGHRAARIDGLVCDLDGVVYVADTQIPGAVAKLNEAMDSGIRVVFCTNNSRLTIAQYEEKLSRFGVAVSQEQIVTSASVTGEFLASHEWGSSAIAVGGDGVHEALRSAGIEVVAPPETKADLVVVGWDLDLTFETLKRATLAITRGARLVATNDDAAYPAPEGLWPGTGAIVAAIERATGETAVVIGKPHEPMMAAVERRLAGCERIAVVGDRPDTDLAGGLTRGWTTILVLSGVTPMEDVAAVQPPPDVVVDSLGDLDL